MAPTLYSGAIVRHFMQQCLSLHTVVPEMLFPALPLSKTRAVLTLVGAYGAEALLLPS